MRQVLIVDDNVTMRRLLRRLFELQFKARVVEACGGNEAISLIRLMKFNLIVSDLSMPDGNGLSIFRYLGQHPEVHAAFILFTGEFDIAPLREEMIVVRKPHLSELFDAVKFLDVFSF